MNKEIWEDILGYEGLYQISSDGEVLNVPRQKIFKGEKTEITKKRILGLAMQEFGLKGYRGASADGWGASHLRPLLRKKLSQLCGVPLFQKYS